MAEYRVLSTVPRRFPWKQKGFSLPELLAVLAIIGLTAGVGAYITSTSRWRGSAAAGEIARRLETARSQAAFNDHNVRVVFDAAAGTIGLHPDRNNDGDVDTGIGERVTLHPLSQAAAHIVFGYPDGVTGLDGAAISAAIEVPGSPPAITFRPTGEALDGVVYLIDDQDLVNLCPAKMRAVSVSAATGRVRVWKYDPTASPVPWRLER